MTASIEALYAAAARAGLLKACTRQVQSGPQQTDMVGFANPDETLLDGLTVGPDVVISFPATSFPGLVIGERMVIDRQVYAVRDIRAVGDGSEKRAKLTKLNVA
jgi:hypothetical protein